MDCKEYNVLNTGTTIATFSYRRCDDFMWVYQAELEPNHIKNVWVFDNTFTTSFWKYFLIEEGPFPPIPPIPIEYLLQENFGFLLQENGDKLIIT